MSEQTGAMTVPRYITRSLPAFLGTGNFRRLKGRIKATEDEFRVEERPSLDFQVTISAGSDLPAQLLTQDGEAVNFTLVKRGMTTFDAGSEIARSFGVPIENVAFGGLKDLRSISAQRGSIVGVDVAKVKAVSGFKPLNGKVGWFMKDVSLGPPLRPGRLTGNHFAIRVRLDGMDKSDIDAYLNPLLSRLARGGMRMPNAYGLQRLGRRLDNLTVASLLVNEGIEAAVKRFLLFRSHLEDAGATELRLMLGEVWQEAESRAPKGKIAEDAKAFRAMSSILEGGNPQGLRYSDFNMSVEAQLVKRAAETGDLTRAVRELKQLCDIWFGAYQAFWFNQVLDRALTGEIRLRQNNAGGPEIPLFVQAPAALAFYNEFCPEAIPERIDPQVSALFATLASTANLTWRPAYTTVTNLEHRTEDAAWNAKFLLRTGAYATSFLGLLFDLTGRDCWAGA